MNLKVGDKVVVITGKDKGKEGKVLAKKKTLKSCKVLVEGINMVKRNVKPNGQNQNGGIIDKESFIDISNVKKVASSAKKNAGKTSKAKKEVKEVKEVKAEKKESKAKNSSKKKSKVD